MQRIKETVEGNEVVPFSIFKNIRMETYLVEVQNLLDSILAEEQEYFCVNMKIKPTNNFKIFIDGDNGITIEKCVSFNRKLYKLIEAQSYFPEGDFSLELSSPGIDEPLKLVRQYTKNIGRNIEIVFNDDTKKEGKLLAVTETEITIETSEGKGKKQIIEQVLIAFENIKTAVVQVSFS